MSANDTTPRYSPAEARRLMEQESRRTRRASRISDALTEREAPLEDAIIAALESAGCFVQKTGDESKFGALIAAVQEYLYRVGLPQHVGNITAIIRQHGNSNDPGVPDLLVHRAGDEEGRLYGFEVKTKGGRVKPAQRRAREAGALVVVRSVEEALESVGVL